ncbi:putative ABC transporter permease [Clostridium paridis]|uniref:ABC transporter permease n=1 Tax=Clostridium paridis TaxID=2803863 RepID=A0A937K3C7_9CLOT|nr:putative ABC transporter permease [Clostridium paridis]MBL4931512.1 putative ABC transporter permease [Clostridium paridis]
MQNIKFDSKMLLFYSNQDSDKTKSIWTRQVKGFELYELFWILILFSIGGFLIESFWCFIKNGYIESRKGLLFGPFCPIYGVGAVVFLFLLNSFRANLLKLALGSFFYGSLVEYIFSFLQENLFGSVSWDYSNIPFNINGRVCLMYSIFWTLSGILFIRYLYPNVALLICLIPRPEGELIASLLFIYICFDVFISVSAILRLVERSSFVQTNNIFYKHLDKEFNDIYLRKIFPNMKFI